MRKCFAAFAACVVAMVMLAAPVPAWAYSNTPPSAIYVNGEDITVDDDHRVECGDGYASWDAETGVLTLDDATITKTYYNMGGSSSGGVQGTDSNCGIYTGNEVDLVIELVGSNTITSGVQTWAFGAGGSITIQGEGTLEVRAGKTSGIHAYRDLIIDGATVRAFSTNNTALHSEIGSVRIVGGAQVEATSSGASSYAIGVAQPGSATDETNIIVTGEGTYLKASSAITAVEEDFPTLYAANNVIFEDGAEVAVDGTVVANNDMTIQSGAAVTVANEGGSYGLYAVGAMTIDSASVSASSVDGYGIVTQENLAASNSTIDAQSTDSNGLRVIKGGATIAGGTVTLTSENHAALRTLGTATISDGIVTLKGTPAIEVGELDFGDASWYQWATAAAGKVTQGASEEYDPTGQNDAYLRIEPTGTTYLLTVSGGKGGGPYVAGTQVDVSADAFNASGHFTEWTVSDPTGAGLLADSKVQQTTFTMPAGAVELTATFGDPHTLQHVARVDSTCTDAGTAEHWTCPECGALFSDAEGDNLVGIADLEIPATGHAWGEPEWSWSEDGTAFIATFTCSYDAGHVETLSAAPVSSIETEPTCTEAGVKLYTATVELDGREYTATSREVIPALGHEYAGGVCVRCRAAEPIQSTGGASIPATGDPLPLAVAIAFAGAVLCLGSASLLRRR